VEEEIGRIRRRIGWIELFVEDIEADVKKITRELHKGESARPKKTPLSRVPEFMTEYFFRYPEIAPVSFTDSRST